jgi:hypothetical protein
MADENLEGALKLVQEGKTKEAHVLLEQLVNSDIHNINAWLWYAQTAPSTRERTRILEACLRLNPDDTDTRRILGLEPEPHAKAAAKAPAPTQNSLAFTASGSAASQADPAQSTQPIKGFSRTLAAASTAATPQKSRISARLLLGIVLLLLACSAAAAWILYSSIPKYPAKYAPAAVAQYNIYASCGDHELAAT